MGRPRPSDTEPAGPESGYGEKQPSGVGSPAPYPPVAPYTPPSQEAVQPGVVSGTPVPFPPMGPQAYAATPPREDWEAPPRRSPNVPPLVGGSWSSGLFDCDLNQTNATMTAFFPCVTFGQIAEILDEGETSCSLGSFMYILMAPALCSCWIMGSNYRLKLRNKFNLVQAPSEDWTVHLFCPCCSLCQEFRELQNRGIDPSLGWMGYLAQQQETSTVPPNKQFMSM